MGIDTDTSAALARLARSAFRARFRLRREDAGYALQTGRDRLRLQARRIVLERLAPAFPRNDGRQTPMRGHPVFLAQHACACCCRGCLEKWHGIPRGRTLSAPEIDAVVALLLAWIDRETERALRRTSPREPDLFSAAPSEENP